MQTSQKAEIGFSHVGLSAHAHNNIIIVQEVEVHGWLLSGSTSEELFAALF